MLPIRRKQSLDVTDVRRKMKNMRKYVKKQGKGAETAQQPTESAAAALAESIGGSTLPGLLSQSLQSKRLAHGNQVLESRGWTRIVFGICIRTRLSNNVV